MVILFVQSKGSSSSERSERIRFFNSLILFSELLATTHISQPICYNNPQLMKHRIFISSEQREFAAERRGLKEYLFYASVRTQADIGRF